MADTISLEELLSAQSKVVNRVTIESVEGKPDQVKVTPWSIGAGCLCHLAIFLPKKSIESVRPTGEKHNCCGKTFSVVEVNFVKDSTITIESLFAQIMTAALAEKSEGHAHSASHHHNHGNLPHGQPCNHGGYNPGNYHSNPRCDPGYVSLACGGVFMCVKPGTTCCFDSPCPPGNFCMMCGGAFQCVPAGSTCCFDTPCTPPRRCYMESGGYVCK